MYNLSLAEMREGFEKLYGKSGMVRCYFAPGRVNIIGEHIDYNGGHVFPCALTVGTYAMVRQRNDRILNFYSYNFAKGGLISASLDDVTYDKKYAWANYALGVISAFAKRGMKLDKGFDVFVYGNIPGSGLSSSASMEVCFSCLIKDMYGFDVSMKDVSIISQEAENVFCGLNCGIMDQFASAMGKKDKAIILDCATLEYSYVPLVLGDYRIIVTNSNKPHSLVTSHYNDRRNECEQALKDLQTELKIKNLCELSVDEFEKYKNLIKDDNCRLRAKHAVYEEQRTKDAIKALEENNLVKLGKLLNESGDSLRYDYDATCFEIDTLVDLAREQKGVLGSRETGGGWGGNTITIIHKNNVEEFKRNVEKEYVAKTGLKPYFAVLEVGDGGRNLF